MTELNQENSEPWTVRRLLSWASEDFKKRGLESPRLEAEILLSFVLQVDRVRLIIDALRPLTEEELRVFREVFQRRRKGEPVAYILGMREFFGRQFRVNADVLVPRPDTETLVEVALQRTAHRHLSGRALDLCTGSGCVALTFSMERPTWKVTGTDLSAAALKVARENSLRLGAVWGVRFLEGNLMQAVPREERFELILANPPYIPSNEVLTLEESVRKFEPTSALDGGESGLDFYPRVIAGAKAQLVRGGVLAVEVGAGQAAEVDALFSTGGFGQIERKKDFGGHERVVSGRSLG